ncbi:DUF928 domain-containing protein [Lyngbya aestuarii]|uniref:DUF928 domain-containing protein n=1 Tax=Lyngbya aestuarii TaxID=118322 RepID=UPI00403DCC02
MAQVRFVCFSFSAKLFFKSALITVFLLLGQLPQTLLAQGIPQRWETKKYQPPRGIGTPRRVEGAGTRTPGRGCPVADKPLTALLPKSHFGVTVAPYPTFFIYMPNLSFQMPPPPVEFALEDREGNEVYQATFRTNGLPGIVAISLPTQVGLSPLQVDQDYKWSFSVICQGDERSMDVVVEGWVRRVALSPIVENQLKQASASRKVELYADAEIWHDALATLVQLRRDHPTDLVVTSDWAKLLSAAGLSNFTQESLAPIPRTSSGT